MRVFVYCPANYSTGGPEALHQFASTGHALGYDIAMVYFPEDHPSPVPENYRCYGAPVSARACDAADAVIVVPETEVHRLAEFRLATRAVWWLSVDNFETRAEMLRERTKAAVSPLNFVFDPRVGCHHLAQSEYARHYLAAKDQPAERTHMLTDFIRSEIVERSRSLRDAGKLDFVAYNPQKGLEFTKALMASSPPELKWLPIQNMTPAQVAELLGHAKAYVDFGGHPGRDRIPREAALCGACVVTGMKGSAANEIDIPVAAHYKIDETRADAHQHTVALLLDIVQRYDAHRPAFDGYRQWVERQEAGFADEVFTTLSTLQAGIRARRRFAL